MTATGTSEGPKMGQSELSERRQRLRRKLAATFEGWHTGRVDRLEEALLIIERELENTRSAEPAEGTVAFVLHHFAPRSHSVAPHRRAQ